MHSNDYLFVDSIDALHQLASDLIGAEWVAIDTEFIRERTYYPKFCLLQLATSTRVACIDALSVTDLSPLNAILDDENIVKVFHAGRQDLEILYRLRGRLPNSIYDTQIAAPFTGLPEQIGYASLVFELLHVRLAKTLSRTDWSQRPLSREQLIYASEDVIYLGPVYESLRKRATELGRTDWITEETRYLQNPETYDPPPESAWQRIGGIASLNAVQITLLKDLACWREMLARDEDCPRNWVVKDEVLLELAKQRPLDFDTLKRIRGIDERAARRHGKALMQLIAECDTTAITESPRRAAIDPETPEQGALLDILSAVVRLRSAQHAISPATLASRKALREFIDAPNDSPLMQGWRRTLVGADLHEMIAGGKTLTITKGEISIVDHGE